MNYSNGVDGNFISKENNLENKRASKIRWIIVKRAG